MPLSVVVDEGGPRGAAVGVAVFSAKGLPKAPTGVTAEVLAKRGFEARPGQTLVLTGTGPSRILVGLGDPAQLTVDGLRRAAGALVRAAWSEPALVTDLLDVAPVRLDRRACAQAIAEGALLASYTYDAYKSQPKACKLQSVTLTGRGGRVAVTGVARGVTVASAVRDVRDLVNAPPGDMNPTDLADIAVAVAAETGLECTVWDEHEIERERLGGLRGVSLGSSQPPRLVKLVYTPSGAAKGKATPTIALVGKGITFDSGGLSLKSGDGMMTMKCDMTGAAVVIAAMGVIASVRPAVRVIGYACITENLPGPSAIKPGDVLKARNGKTMEVLNTDAEGRLVLADGLSLAVEDKVDAIVDIATLTGAVVVALGRDISGLFANNDAFAAQVLQASERAGESMWRLPMPPSYRRHIDSEVADMKNIGMPGQAGSIAAALFLQEFVGSTPWAHLDIAGTGWADATDGLTAKGGTGASLRTLVELVEHFERPAR